MWRDSDRIRGGHRRTGEGHQEAWREIQTGLKRYTHKLGGDTDRHGENCRHTCRRTQTDIERDTYRLGEGRQET